MAAEADRAVAGNLGEQQEQALFGELAAVSDQVADSYDQWVRTGSDESRRAALASASAILPLLEKLRAHHQGHIDKAQADIIRDDGNPEVLYKEHWWQVDRGFTLAAAGQLSWLHYRMAMLSPSDKDKRKAWLEKAAQEFSEFVGASDPKMRMESILGRGLTLGELGETSEAESDLQLVLEQSKGTTLYWPARMALGQMKASASGSGGLAETQRLLSEAQSGGVNAAMLTQIRMLRLEALLQAMSAGGGDNVRSEAATLAAQLSSLGPSYSQRVTAMAVAHLKDPRPVLGATVSAEWIAAENLAAAEKFEEAAKAYEKIEQSGNAGSHENEVHHRLGVCYFRLGRYADSERELRKYLDAAPKGALAPEAAYLQFRAAEGIYRASATPETEGTFFAVVENFVKNYPDHESHYEGLFRYAELLQGQRRYADAADAFEKVEGPPAFRLRAAANELQCLADTIATTDNIVPERAAELRSRAEDAWKRFDKLSSGGGASASEDLKARTTVAHAMAVGSGPGADSTEALSLLDGFEAHYPKVSDLALPVAAIRAAGSTAQNRIDVAEPAVKILAAMPDTEANYFDIVEKLSRALLRRSADAAPTDPAASQRWAAMATTLLDRMRAAGKPIPEEVKLNLAMSYVEQNRLSDAASLYAELLHAQPESRSLLRASALLADRRGQNEDAAGLWSRLAMLQQVATPAWYEARLALAGDLVAAGQKDKACQSVREVDGFHPDLRDAPTKKQFADVAAKSCAGP
ncbi:MAG TPA: tetratricopeptide repeat protein [Candidatus Binatia bacterium]